MSTTDTETRPYWLTTPCPTWCAAPHHRTEDIEDADHFSESHQHTLATTQGRVLRWTDPDGTKRYDVVPAEIYAGVEQHHLERSARVVLCVDPEAGDDFPPRTLKLTMAEARTLAQRLTQLADIADTDQ